MSVPQFARQFIAPRPARPARRPAGNPVLPAPLAEALINDMRRVAEAAG